MSIGPRSISQLALVGPWISTGPITKTFGE